MKKITLLLFLLTYYFGLSQTTDLISNGNFHNCNEDWAITGDFTYDCGDPNPLYTHFNNSYGYGYNLQIDDASGGLGQSMNYPSNVTSATLVIYHKISTEETDNNTAYDKLTIFLISDSQTYTVDELSNKDNATSYIKKSYTIPANLFDDEVVTLAFVVENDGAKPTRFRVDDVSLLATQGNVGNENNYNIGVENVSVSDTTPDVGQTITLTCNHIVTGDCGCTDNFDDNPDVGFGYSTSSNYDINNFTLIGTESSTIGEDTDDQESIDWVVPNILEGQTVYLYFIPDYNKEHTESIEGEYSTVQVNVNGNTQATEGLITINLSPIDVINSGAQWKTSSSSVWKSSGETVTLPFGTYTIEFKDVSGWTKPSNEVITISESNTTYSNTFIYEEVAIINPSNGSISGTYSNPTINDSFQIVNGSLKNTRVSLYKNGELINQANEQSGQFTFNNLTNGFYQVIAEYITNGTVAFHTQKGVTINDNSASIELALSQELAEKIEGNNNELKSLSCQWNSGDNSTGLYYNLLDDISKDSYNTVNSELYIKKTENVYIENNYDEVIDKLSRLAIITKATKDFFDSACSITNEYLTTVSDASHIAFNVLKYFKCRGVISNSLTSNQISELINEGLISSFRWAFLKSLENINYSDSKIIENTFDILLDDFLFSDTTDLGISFISKINDLNLGRIWIEPFLKEGYIDYTYNAFNNSVSDIYNNNHIVSIETLSTNMKQRVDYVKSIVTSTNINVTSYRNLPSWLNETQEFFNNIGQATCNKTAITISVLSQALEGIILYDSFWHARQGRNTLRDSANNGINYGGSKNSSNLKTTCSDEKITPLIDEYTEIINLYNTKVSQTIYSINNSSYNDTLYNELKVLTEEINKKQNILTNTFLMLEYNSTLENTLFEEKMKILISSAPALRLSLLINLKSFLINNDAENKKDLIDNELNIINENLLAIANLNEIKNSINDFSTPVFIDVVKNKLPVIIENNITNSYELELMNYGCDTAENVSITISSIGDSVIFNETNIQLGNIDSYESKTVYIAMNSAETEGNVEYTLNINNTSTNSVNKIKRNISVRKNIGTLSDNDFLKKEKNITIYPNPTEDILNIQKNNNISIDQIEVFDTLGNLIFKTTKSIEAINVSNYSGGIYVIKVLSNDVLYSHKFIKK